MSSFERSYLIVDNQDRWSPGKAFIWRLFLINR